MHSSTRWNRSSPRQRCRPQSPRARRKSHALMSCKKNAARRSFRCPRHRRHRDRWFAFEKRRFGQMRRSSSKMEARRALQRLHVDPLTRLSTNGLWKGFDLGFIDGIVNGIGHFVMESATLSAAASGLCPQLRRDHPRRRSCGDRILYLLRVEAGSLRWILYLKLTHDLILLPVVGTVLRLRITHFGRTRQLMATLGFTVLNF